MNTSLIKSALAMTAAFAVGSALAGTVTNQIYGATFESSLYNSEINDYLYDATSKPSISSYADGNFAKWYAGSADDASVITTEDYYSGSQALKLQTEGGTLTNEFQGDVLSAINAARTGEGTNLLFEAQVKFVASDSLVCDVETGADAKFALYAYAPEDGNSTNLVVFHKTQAGVYTNDITNYVITNDTFKHIAVEYFTEAETKDSFFSVKVDGIQVESIDPDLMENPIDLDDEDNWIWFRTINDKVDDNNLRVSSLCFKGTGFVDDIAIKSVATEEEPPPVGYNLGVTIDDGVASVTITDSASVDFVTDATTNFTGVAAGNASIAITYDAWYVAAGDYATGAIINISADTNIVITAAKTTSNAEIDAGAFTNATPGEMSALVDWAVANGKSVNDVKAMTFADALNPTDDEKSFLLGTGTAKAITEEAAIEELEIVSIEYVNGEWVVTTQGGADGADLGNGHIDIFGATSLAGPWAADTVDAKFFKAVLVK